MVTQQPGNFSATQWSSTSLGTTSVLIKKRMNNNNYNNIHSNNNTLWLRRPYMKHSPQIKRSRRCRWFWKIFLAVAWLVITQFQKAFYRNSLNTRYYCGKWNDKTQLASVEIKTHINYYPRLTFSRKKKRQVLTNLHINLGGEEKPSKRLKNQVVQTCKWQARSWNVHNFPSKLPTSGWNLS